MAIRSMCRPVYVKEILLTLISFHNMFSIFSVFKGILSGKVRQFPLLIRILVTRPRTCDSENKNKRKPFINFVMSQLFNIHQQSSQSMREDSPLKVDGERRFG